MTTVQNVTFFSKKNMIQICRGMKKVWCSYTQEGVLVVKMKGFDRYWFCPDTGNVFARKSARLYEVIKRHEDEHKFYFWLYKNGQKLKVYQWEVFFVNKDGIETFGKDRVENGGSRNYLKLVA